jgi:hypothetical protein
MKPVRVRQEHPSSDRTESERQVMDGHCSTDDEMLELMEMLSHSGMVEFDDLEE